MILPELSYTSLVRPVGRPHLRALGPRAAEEGAAPKIVDALTLIDG